MTTLDRVDPSQRHEDQAQPMLDVAQQDPTLVTSPAPTSVPITRRVGMRQVLTVIAIVVAVLCAGGLGAGYLLYDRATTPDRNSPGVVVRQYLYATFDERNKARAALFVCNNPKSLREIQNVLTDVKAREVRFDVKITVGWEDFNVVSAGKVATVSVDLLIQVPELDGSTSESIQHWNFRTEFGSGWRVCGAHRVD